MPDPIEHIKTCDALFDRGSREYAYQQVRLLALELLGERDARREAVGKASHALEPDQGGRPDVSLASMWLRTTFPPEHPNYLTREQVEHYATKEPELPQRGFRSDGFGW